MQTIIRALLAPLALSALVAVAGGCSDHPNSQGSPLKGEAAFDPVPSAAEQETVDGQLKRFKGQTKFLTPYNRYFRGIFDAAGGARPEANAASAQRAVQEADVFKIGVPGSKLLYLLNNYRGLQVVSYEDGADRPQIAGRVAATGNYPDQMYFDEANKRLLVLENVWYDQDGDYYDYSTLQSRLVIYDVADAHAPKIAQTLALNGEVSESRMVGKVLYVATSVRPSWDQRQRSQNGKGYVYSFGLESAGVAAVETKELAAPVSYGAKMNVVEIKAGDAFKYYLIAVLSKDGWGWWDRQSLVEVVDISDAGGKINPLMVVSAKGGVRERSQTTIKNDTLLVTSNYLVGTTNTARVSVETFKLPAAGAEVIDNNEAEYRRLGIDRAVEKKRLELTAQGVTGDALEDQLNAYKEQLVGDATLGLKGRFVKTAADDGSQALVKKVPDSVVTIGNTQGLSASVQDVRYNGNLLYVFWVPTNNLDPLDVFDISAPEAGVTHLSHLEFDGWIQRAVPLTYQGRDFVLGLGWVVPSVNNEHNRRFPQAMLFEVTRTAGGRVSAQVLAQQTIGTSGTWADFNGEDKEIEVNFTGDGKGAVMFTFSSWDGTSYLNGGKLIGFDVTQADVDATRVFTEGGILSTLNEGWLRRLFTNPEITRVNSFSDEALGTYDLAQGLGAAGAILRATNILELARNVRAYETLTTADAAVRTVGVQILSDWYWSDDGATELRAVDAAKADAEKPQALSAVKVPGSYVDHVKGADDALFVLSQKNERQTGSDGSVTYKTRYVISLVRMIPGQGLTLAAQNTWDYSYGEEAAGPRLGYLQKLVKLADGRILAATGNTLKLLAVGAESTLAVTAVTLNGCSMDGADVATLHDHGGRLYISMSQTVKDDHRLGLEYLRNFVADAAVADATLTCAAPLNIPGKVLNVVEGRQVVTNDVRHVDFVQRGTGESTYWEEITADSVDSLQIATLVDRSVARLVDLYDPKNVAVDSMKVVDGDKLLFVDSTAVPYYGWEWGGGIGIDNARDGIWYPGHHAEAKDNRLVLLGFDGELGFTKTAYHLEMPASTNASLRGVFASDRAGEGYLLAIGQGRKIGVFAFDLTTRPVARKLALVNAQGGREDPQDFITSAGGYWYWYGSNDAMHFTPALRSIELSSGNTGVVQAYVTD